MWPCAAQKPYPNIHSTSFCLRGDTRQYRSTRYILRRTHPRIPNLPSVWFLVRFLLPFSHHFNGTPLGAFSLTQLPLYNSLLQVGFKIYIRIQLALIVVECFLQRSPGSIRDATVLWDLHPSLRQVVIRHLSRAPSLLFAFRFPLCPGLNAATGGLNESSQSLSTPRGS